MSSLTVLIQTSCLAATIYLTHGYFDSANAANNPIEKWYKGVAVCVANGGTEIPQPPGSSITACCTNDPDNEVQYCIICDEYGEDCQMDIAESRRPDRMQPAQIEPPEVVAPIEPVSPRFNFHRITPAAPVAQWGSLRALVGVKADVANERASGCVGASERIGIARSEGDRKNGPKTAFPVIAVEVLRADQTSSTVHRTQTQDSGSFQLSAFASLTALPYCMTQAVLTECTACTRASWLCRGPLLIQIKSSLRVSE